MATFPVRPNLAAPPAAVAYPSAPMPKTRTQSPASGEAPARDPLVVARSRADALYRCAVESCRQHDRSAKRNNPDDDEEPELEHAHLDAMCKMCDSSLGELAQEYKDAAGLVPAGTDEPWWHKANQLWHASRECANRHAGCELMAKRITARHNAEQLGSVQMEYELAASSLLALRHAADAYRKTRPDLA